MTTFPVHPLTLLFYGLVLVAIGALVQLVRSSRRRETASFPLAALTLLACLDAMAFLGGFSIGPLLVLVASVLAVVLAAMVRSYRVQVGLACLATLLLAAGMWTGTFANVRLTLGIGLVSAVVVAMVQLGRGLTERGVGAFGGWGLTLTACLGGLSLLLGSTPGSLWSRLPLPAAVLGLGLALVSKRYRPPLLLVALANVLLGLGFLSA